MRWSRPVALAIAAGIFAWVIGAVLTLAGSTLGLGGGSPVSPDAATATVLLVTVAVLAAVLVGLRGGETASTPYW